MRRFSLTVVQGADNMPEGCELTEDTEGDYMLVSDHVAHTAALVRGLREILDGDGECHCDCADENCCVKAGAFCPHCIAQRTLDGQP